MKRYFMLLFCASIFAIPALLASDDDEQNPYKRRFPATYHLMEAWNNSHFKEDCKFFWDVPLLRMTTVSTLISIGWSFAETKSLVRKGFSRMRCVRGALGISSTISSIVLLMNLSEQQMRMIDYKKAMRQELQNKCNQQNKD